MVASMKGVRELRLDFVGEARRVSLVLTPERREGEESSEEPELLCADLVGT